MNRMRGLCGHTTPSGETVRMLRVTLTGGRVWIASQLSVVAPTPTGTFASSNGRCASSDADNVSRR